MSRSTTLSTVYFRVCILADRCCNSFMMRSPILTTRMPRSSCRIKVVMAATKPRSPIRIRAAGPGRCVGLIYPKQENIV